jgi:hypothetical protein
MQWRDHIRQTGLSMYQPFYDLYQHINHFWSGRYKKWLLLDGHSLPLSQMYAPSTEAEWTYHEGTHTLSHSSESSTSCAFSWLSVKLVTIHKGISNEFDMDPFLETLTIHTSIAPSLMVLFLAWCAHTKHWFPKNSLVQFHIIDREGQERMLTLSSDCNCLILEGTQIYDQPIRYIETFDPFTHYHA